MLQGPHISIRRETGHEVTIENHSQKSPLAPNTAPSLHARHPQWTESFSSPARRSAYIQQVCTHIAERYHPDKIILLGSHAWGQPTPESDLDLLMVVNFSGGPVRQAIAISRALGLVTPMELLPRTPEQLRHRLEIGDSFMQEIVSRGGKVMYETRHV